MVQRREDTSLQRTNRSLGLQSRWVPSNRTRCGTSEGSTGGGVERQTLRVRHGSYGYDVGIRIQTGGDIRRRERRSRARARWAVAEYETECSRVRSRSLREMDPEARLATKFLTVGISLSLPLPLSLLPSPRHHQLTNAGLR